MVRGTGLRLATAPCVTLLLCAALVASASAEERSMALPGGASVEYLPPFAGEATPPLVAFIDASFWGLRPEQAPAVREMVIRPLRTEGVAVARIRHRPAPVGEGRAYAEDVAAALAWLFDQRAALGFDTERVVLLGHGSGGQLASLVALDPSYLAKHGHSPASLSAVVPISALYDLDAVEGVPDELFAYAKRAYPKRGVRKQAAPLRHLRADAPTFIALAAANDVPGLAAGAAGFTEALRAAGHPRAETFVALARDHYSVLALGDLGNTARDHVLALCGLGRAAEQMDDLILARATWRAPPFSSEGFWQHDDLIEAKEPTPEVDAWVRRYFGSGPGGVGSVRTTWHSIPLEAWLERSGLAGGGRWLVLTNARGERGVIDLEALRPYGPRLVVGIGNERNLFEVVDLYHTLRRYTWKQAEPENWLLARPLGAFIAFDELPPRTLVPGVFGLFALTPESFARTSTDPLASVRAVRPPALAEMLIDQKNCVACHGFLGADARVGHLRARDGALVGGFALPLTEYPAPVWRRYVYDQLKVAAEIGANAVVLDPAEQDLLFRGIEAAR